FIAVCSISPCRCESYEVAVLGLAAAAPAAAAAEPRAPCDAVAVGARREYDRPVKAGECEAAHQVADPVSLEHGCLGAAADEPDAGRHYRGVAQYEYRVGRHVAGGRIDIPGERRARIAQHAHPVVRGSVRGDERLAAAGDDLLNDVHPLLYAVARLDDHRRIQDSGKPCE